ncbi:hypothetical protein [Neobacillus bataviensis]
MINAIVLFVLAGLAEIGGGYLIWLKRLFRNNVIVLF